MSELKSIVFHAIVNNMKPEYNHLGYFGVCTKETTETPHMCPHPPLVGAGTCTLDIWLTFLKVTVLSFWNCSVRVVQGLVNFRTYDIDLRRSPVQHFQDGFWLPDGSIDKRFLTFLDYNCSKVVPLPK